MEMKRSAQILGKELKAIGMDVKHTDLLEMVAKANGHKSWASATKEEQVFEIPISIECCESRIMEVRAMDAKDAFLKVYNNINYLTYLVDRRVDDDFDLDQRDIEMTVEYSAFILKDAEGQKTGGTGYHILDQDGKVHVVTEKEIEAIENAGNV